VAVAAVTRISHSVARLTTAPAAAPSSLSRQVRDTDAVDEELRSLAEISTWDYVGLEDVPAGVTPISSKWVFKTKELPGGGIRYKARLVIRGFEQQAGVDFDETFAPVAKLQSLHMMLALAVVHDWEFKQMDAVTAFLNPNVDGDVYMALPQGIEADKPQVSKLRKSLYGLKQAPRFWYEHIDHFLRSLGLQSASTIRMSISRQAPP